MKPPYGIHKNIEFVNRKDNTTMEVPTILMGDGSIKVMSTGKTDEGISGIAFSDAPDNKRGVGVFYTEDTGKNMLELDVKFALMFDNPDSVDVVIEMLLEAKHNLLC